MKISSALLLVLAVVPALAPAAKSSALSADDIFSPKQLTLVKISPSGQRQLLVQETDNSFKLILASGGVDSRREIFDYHALFGAKKGEFVHASWLDDRHIMVILVESRNAIAELIDTKTKRLTYIIDADNPPREKEQVISIRNNGWLVHSLPSEPGKFLYAKSGINSRIYKLDIGKLYTLGQKLGKADAPDGGQFVRKNIWAKVEGSAARWYISGQSTVVGALVRTQDNQLKLMETGDGGKNWTALKVWGEKPEPKTTNWSWRKRKEDNKNKENKAQETLIPIAYAGQPGQYYVISESDSESDSLYRHNFNSGEQNLIYQHPEGDIFSAEISQIGDRLLGVGIVARGEVQYVYFGDTYKNIVSKVRAKGVSGYLAIVQSDLGNRNYIVYNFANNNPGSYLLYSEANNQITLLGEVLPGLSGKLHSKLISGTVDSDGLDIEYFLTMPERAVPGGHPLVLVPHGGPLGVMDNRLYDPVSQYFSSRGMAVLQVNYRGSSGYGKSFMEQGKKQWGSGILDDIVRALRAVTARKDINARKVCVVGGSYGGYAALALAIKHPNTFRCAASLAGVTDVQLITSELAISEGKAKWWVDHIGDPEREAQYLKRISPVYNAEKLKLPLLLAHGTEDHRVDIEHFYRLSYALKQRRIPFEKSILEGEGHNFSSNTAAAKFYTHLGDFLARHLMANASVSAASEK